MTALPSQESQPIGNYSESCTQFRMPKGWEADYAAYLKRWNEQNLENNELNNKGVKHE